MQISKKANFDPCPEFMGKGVCVDVTPLQESQGKFGTQQTFRIVFEIDMDKEDREGERWCVWSRQFTPSLSEKANLRKFLRGWFGQDLTKEQLDAFETESLIGKPAQLVVVHEHKDAEVYANIASCTPDKSGSSLVPTGKYVRKQDRPQNGASASSSGSNGGAGYRRAEQPTPSATPEKVDYGLVKVHVGRFVGLELRDLAPDQVQKLVDNWLPTTKAQPKQTADDKRLIAALESWKANQTAAKKENDDLPY